MNDKLSDVRIRNVFDALHCFFIVYLMCSWLFPFSIQRVALIGFFSTYIIDAVFNKRVSTFKWTKEKLVYVAFILFYLMIPLWQMFIGSFSDRIFLNAMERRLPFLAIGLVGLLGINERIKIQYFAYAMVSISTMVILYLLWQVVTTAETIQIEKIPYLFMLERLEHVNSHMVFNLYLNIALGFCLYTLFKVRLKCFLKILLGVGGLLIFCTLMISEGRTGFVTALLQLGSFFVYISFIKKRQLTIPVLVVALVGFFALHLNKRMDTNPLQDSRMAIWNVCTKMIKEKPLFGYGVSNARRTLVEEGIADKNFYEDYYTYFLVHYPKPEQRFAMHPHNMFLESIMEFGFLGLLILIFIFIYPLLIIDWRTGFFIGLFLSVIFIQGVFETLGPSIQPLCFILGLLVWFRQGKEC